PKIAIVNVERKHRYLQLLREMLGKFVPTHEFTRIQDSRIRPALLDDRDAWIVGCSRLRFKGPAVSIGEIANGAPDICTIGTDGTRGCKKESHEDSLGDF